MRLDVSPHATLADAQAAAEARIDEAAGRARARYITVTPGQEATYVEKGRQAEAYRAAGYPADLTSYPWIQAEVNATGKTPQQAADDILAQRDQWIALGAQIEELRIKGKSDIRSATTKAQVRQLADQAVAALDAI